MRFSHEQFLLLCQQLPRLGAAAQDKALSLITAKPSRDAPFAMQFIVDDPNHIYGLVREDNPDSERDLLRVVKFERSTGRTIPVIDLT